MFEPPENLDPLWIGVGCVFWLDRTSKNPWGRSNVFITRLHVRYTRDKFPEDLKFQSTSDRTDFQGRYIINHPFRGEMTCREASQYQQTVRDRQEKEAQNLARLTGWDISDIRSKIEFIKAKSVPWWRNIWE